MRFFRRRRLDSTEQTVDLLPLLWPYLDRQSQQTLADERPADRPTLLAAYMCHAVSEGHDDEAEASSVVRRISDVG